MPRILIVILCLLLFAQSCGSSKRKVSSSSKTTLPVQKDSKLSKETESLVKSARHYKGTRYKYGGDSKRGIDCSGLIFMAFNEIDKTVPRTTSQLQSYGNWVDLKDVKTGDLVFFATKKNSRKVNHVGLVTEVSNGDLSFIHSSTSKGVIESHLSERYWYFAFVQARRVL